MYPQPSQEQKLIHNVSLSLAEGAGWMKLLGTLSIISGILQVITLVGIISGGLQIWMGSLLFQSASSAEQARATGDSALLASALNNIKTYFMINGIFALIGILLVVLALCLLVVLPMLGMIPFLINPQNF